MRKIKVKVNTVIRATGLRSDTPVHILEKCMGVDVIVFAEHAIILNGLKAIRFESLEPFDRVCKIRPNDCFGVFGTMKNRFMRIWNDLDIEKRKLYRNMEIDKLKSVLKSERTLTYTDSIFTEYKWISLKNPVNT